MPAAPKFDENELREAPPPATAVQFPSYSPQKATNGEADQFDVVKLFGNVSRTGVLSEHLEAFNITIIRDIPLEDLVSADFTPPISWFNNTTMTESSDFTTTPPLTSLLSNGRDAPDQQAFFKLAKELLHDNGDAFRAARRLPGSQGRPTPHIIHSRKFWNGLADMAEYWDTSLDHYTDPEEDKDKDAMDIDELRSEAQRATEDQPKNENKKLYKGRRMNTGSRMPNRFREETVSGFVEMLIWAFGCTLEPPSIQPKVQIHNVLFNLPFNKAVHRVPKDARKARGGVKEGPMMGVWCREQTKFREAGEAEGEGKAEILDLLKESGLTTMLAQKRAREGKEETIPGTGKWWATKPRWGGGPGGESETSRSESERKQGPSKNVAQQPQRNVKKNAPTDLWRAMRPPPSLWEKGVSYQRIGKARESVYDDIYLISAVNHHVSIVHTRMHTKYIDLFVGSDGQPQQDKENMAKGEAWYGMEMQRSRWFDLFKADDRVELLRGVWGVVGYLMRVTDDGNDGGKGKELSH